MTTYASTAVVDDNLAGSSELAGEWVKVPLHMWLSGGAFAQNTKSIPVSPRVGSRNFPSGAANSIHGQDQEGSGQLSDSWKQPYLMLSPSLKTVEQRALWNENFPAEGVIRTAGMRSDMDSAITSPPSEGSKITSLKNIYEMSCRKSEKAIFMLVGVAPRASAMHAKTCHSQTSAVASVNAYLRV
ncbi:MAG: hypothetical protein M1834_007146 [Cirrosporium novae-zelandiae]|nr:MAG: hypothetical protein M1834_007146 [Cirrosporium novae-zelandiae]